MTVVRVATWLVVALAGCDAAPPPSPAEAPAPVAAAPTLNAAKVQMYPELQAYIATILPEMAQIPAERKAELDRIADFVRARRAAGDPAQITFICTHNSRRSHMGQLWAAVAAAHFGVDGVKTFSGGTEATAFNPRAVAALKRAGMRIDGGAEETNPHYVVRFSDEAPAQDCFSKKYDDPSNPQEGFAAVMTCSEADEACPMVQGAALRVSLPYVDPKASDGTPEETAAYDGRSRQIAAEMFYLFERAAG